LISPRPGRTPPPLIEAKMKLVVSGKTKEFTPELERKFTAKLTKLGKHIEQRGERDAKLYLDTERHLQKVELIVNWYDHSLIALGADPDLDTALCQALEKLEKQILKLRARWRDTHRDPKAVRSTKESWEENASPVAVEVMPEKPGKSRSNGRPAKPRVYRIDYNEDRKPMTLEEAMIEMESDDSGYVVYRDSQRDCLSVLVRRPDGNFDLIES
jgi:putative sigma-54 modulation protein